MKFSVTLMILNYGATKTHKSGFYTEGANAQEAIEVAKELSKKSNPHGTFVEAESAYRMDGSSIGHSWVNPKFIVGA
jgi:hypothetical protein